MKWLRANLLTLIAMLAAGAATYVSASVDRRVAPVEAKIDEHIHDVERDRQFMIEYARWSSRAIFALCKAQSDASCPDPPTFPPK